MTSNIRTRYINATRYIADQLDRTATILEHATTDCPHALAHNTLVAAELRRLQRIVMGDIGKPEEQEEWEIEPITTPVPEQEPVPS